MSLTSDMYRLTSRSAVTVEKSSVKFWKSSGRGDSAHLIADTGRAWRDSGRVLTALFLTVSELPVGQGVIVGLGVERA